MGAAVGTSTALRLGTRVDNDPKDSGGTKDSGVGKVGKVGRLDPGARVARLAEFRAAGLVHHASERVDPGVERSLPVTPALRPLFSGGILRRGSTVAVTSGSPVRPAGSTSLLFALLAEASAAGSWCAVVGLPRLGLVAAAEAGVAVHRLALVPSPGPDWAAVVAALLDGVDIVAVATPGGVPAQVASRLTARARQRGVVLVPVGRWPGADLTLETVATTWHGLGQGRGRLRRHELTVVAHGRGAAARARRAQLWLPGAPEAGPTSLPVSVSDQVSSLSGSPLSLAG
jgi:hypothetical protein